MKVNLEALSPGEAFVVKWQYGGLGTFKTALADCIAKADTGNLKRLVAGFPEEVRGIVLYTGTPGWWDKVKVKAGIKEAS